MRGVLVVVLGMLSVVPVAFAQPGAADACAAADAQVDALMPSTWYEACVAQADLGSEVALWYTQAVLSCWNEGRSCSYQPTFHVSLDTLGAGEWVVRATSRELTYPGLSTISGSTRSLDCRVAAGETHCDAAVDNKAVTGSNFQSARWEGSWSLFLVGPDGAERLMSTGAADGWLAQYCSCE